MTDIQISLDPHCLLVRSPLLKIDGELEWGIRTPCETPFREDEQKYMTKDLDKLPLIAHHYYGDVKLWWVIYDYNLELIGKSHPLFLPAGLLLRIPSKDRVTSEVLNGQGI